MTSDVGSNFTVGAYRNLRAAIISCRIKPGEKLIISDLCKDLGVSLGAVREALSRLASEGLVIATPQKGFRVTPISQEELEDLTRVRALIEGECLVAAIAAGDLKWEAGIISSLYELSKIPIEDPAEPGRTNQAWSQVHATFHAALVAACASPWLLRLREMLYAQSERYRQYSVPLDHLKRDVHAEHQAIADAAIGRDAARARTLLGEHLAKTTRIIADARAFGPAAATREKRVEAIS